MDVTLGRKGRSQAEALHVIETDGDMREGGAKSRDSVHWRNGERLYAEIVL